jgi:hypothetical protein
MKKIIIGSLFLLLWACQDSPHTNVSHVKGSFDKNSGSKIDNELGAKWIENFKSNRINARNENVDLFKISKVNLNKLLKNSGVIGITFHYAIDENGVWHIIAIPLNEHLSLWSPLQIAIDALEDKEIDNMVAQQHIQNYKASYPSHVRYHLFGVNIFDEIKLNKEFEIHLGEDDNQVPQLLLIVRPNQGAGRTSAAELVTYDQAPRCPPRCPE